MGVQIITHEILFSGGAVIVPPGKSSYIFFGILFSEAIPIDLFKINFTPIENYIAENLGNPIAALNLLEFKNFVVYYVVIDDEVEKIMGVRRFLYSKQDSDSLI